jgi:hypothetical protein
VIGMIDVQQPSVISIVHQQNHVYFCHQWRFAPTRRLG